MSAWQTWKTKARELQAEVYALYLANKDPRVPWYAKAFAACVVAYATSPIDLIPDVIPVLGHLDDALLVPLGVYLALKMIPADVVAECRERARAETAGRTLAGSFAAAVIVALWVAPTALAVWLLLRAFPPARSWFGRQAG